MLFSRILFIWFSIKKLVLKKVEYCYTSLILSKNVHLSIHVDELCEAGHLLAKNDVFYKNNNSPVFGGSMKHILFGMAFATI